MKGRIISILAYNKFTFGEQVVSQFVLFECKWLFSVIIFYFHKSGGEQDRFHTHAFNAFSVKLFGRYDEYILLDEKTGECAVRPRTNVFQYFPRNSYHKIGKSTGCMTILFSGPWKKTWEEYINGEVVQYKWNRNTDKKEKR